MKLKLRKRTAIPILMAFLLFFTAVLPLPQGISKAMAASDWQTIGNSTTGLNVDVTKATTEPSMIHFNNELYVAWSEDESSSYKRTIQIKKFNGTDWEYVTGGANFNADPSAEATRPMMAVFHNELYITWYELTNQGNLIRVKKYDGARWTFVNGGGSNGLNMNSPSVAYAPHLIVYNNDLYIVWAEGDNGPYQIRVKKYNGSTWEWVDGGSSAGLNANPTLSASGSASAVYDGNLYISWSERNGAASQVRVKKFDGTTWSFVDGPDGLGNDSFDNLNGSLTVFNNALYAVFTENNGTGTGAQLRVKKYDGINWTSADGGGNVGLNVNMSKNARHPYSTVYNNALYVTWSEVSGNNWGGELRVTKYDGTNWEEASPGVLNINPSQPSAMNPNLSAYDGKLYAAWIESNGYQNQVRVKQYDGNAWTSAHDEISIGLNGNLIYSYDPDLKQFNDELYTIWVENGKIVSGKYSNGTVYPLSGPEGLNVDPTKVAEAPKLAVFNNQLYASWVERDDANVRILRIKKWDNDLGFWDNDVDCCRNGLNTDSRNQALHPNLLSADDGIYAAWAESASVGYDIHVKKFDGTWKSLGHAASHTFGKPSLAIFQNELYGSWLELNDSMQYKARIKKYNGQDWVYVDNGGVNESPDIGNSISSIVEFNNELYVVWNEPSAGGALLKMMRFDGTRWEPVESITTAVGLTTPPDLQVFGDSLFATWSEMNGQAEQIRVKQFNGTNWYDADGGGRDGLNVDATKRAFAPVLEVYNDELYAAWAEYNGVSNQIRMARYTGSIIPPADPTPESPIELAAPTGLIATTPEDGQVFLQWNSVTGATYYQVYQGVATGSYDFNPVVKLSGTTNSTLITGLSSDLTYYFAVQAGNENGVSPLSAEVTAVPQANRKTDLRTLALSQGTLNPAFDNRILNYTTTVPNHVSSVTVTASVYDRLSTLTVNGAVVTSGLESGPIHLAVGNNTISTEVTAADGTLKTYTVRVTRESAPSSSGTSSSSSSNSAPAPSSGQTMTNQITSSTVTNENGQTVVNVSINSAKMIEQLTKDGDNQTLVISVTQDADKVSVLLDGDVLNALEQFQQTVLAIMTPNGNYKLPAAQFNLERLSAEFGEQVQVSDLSVQVVVAKSDTTKEILVGAAADKGLFTVMAAPVDFTITATYKNKTIDIVQFSKFVEREIPIPSGTDPSKITTAVVLNDDGTIRHVPTQIVSRNGITYAVIKSLTNSTYLLISHQKTFGDVQEHWANNAITDLVSRKVVNGIDAEHYAPNAPITRAEFAAIIVRALGMDNKGMSADFKDVGTSDWYNSAVAAAQEYGIIEGYADGTFQPGKTITREEAMVIIARAMKLTDLDTDVNGVDTESILSAFADGSSVEAWAKPGVSAVVNSKLVKGNDIGLLPKTNITRAEATALVHRMLEKAQLIGGMGAK
ncbi:hypothetical protein YSY43_30530 [Paenibacillus sp. YSY-4.3]